MCSTFTMSRIHPTQGGDGCRRCAPSSIATWAWPASGRIVARLAAVRDPLVRPVQPFLRIPRRRRRGGPRGRATGPVGLRPARDPSPASTGGAALPGCATRERLRTVVLLLRGLPGHLLLLPRPVHGPNRPRLTCAFFRCDWSWTAGASCGRLWALAEMRDGNPSRSGGGFRTRCTSGEGGWARRRACAGMQCARFQGTRFGVRWDCRCRHGSWPPGPRYGSRGGAPSSVVAS